MSFDTAAVDPLVEHRQQVIEDRAIGIEEFVQKHEFGLGQHTGRDRGHDALTEPNQINWAKYFIGFGEPGQHVFEVPPADRRRKLPNQGGFRGSRRPMQEQVLAGHKGQPNKINDLIPLDKLPLEHVDDFVAQTSDDGANHPSESPSS
jgi:hypothetical protein